MKLSLQYELLAIYIYIIYLHIQFRPELVEIKLITKLNICKYNYNENNNFSFTLVI